MLISLHTFSNHTTNDFFVVTIGFEPMTASVSEKNSTAELRDNVRRERDSNPRTCYSLQFSRLMRLTALPSLRIWVTNGNRTHDTRYHKPLLYLLSYNHHLNSSSWIYQESRLTNSIEVQLHTPLESWVLLPILSVYPCVTSLHVYQPTLFYYHL